MGGHFFEYPFGQLSRGGASSASVVLVCWKAVLGINWGWVLFIVCVAGIQTWAADVRIHWASQSLVLMTACLFSSGPLGCCPFLPPFHTLIGRKCSCHFIDKLGTFRRMLNMTGVWSLWCDHVCIHTMSRMPIFFHSTEQNQNVKIVKILTAHRHKLMS